MNQSRLFLLKLSTVLKKKNPYLFRAKAFESAGEIVKGITDAFLSSNEETIFGDWLERLAIFVNGKVYSGWKSGIEGIDLEFDKNKIRYIVSIKSGPNWGNSSQVKKMRASFVTAKKTLRTSNSKMQITAVNGCCYGKDNNPDKGDYFKYCGQVFWEFISGDDNLYREIIEPLGFEAKERNEKFLELYVPRLNLFTMEFIDKFCKSDGNVDWEKLVQFNSGQ
ncbi:MAG: hypothetical protein LBU65_05960 [Planctomycetaceae bacterium]|jgi:hypothetical protein|nr:hypothetical protein [Planctomycetaceae bacterium]